MRVRVWCWKYFGPENADWSARCSCGEATATFSWASAMEFALGHLSLRHGRSA